MIATAIAERILKGESLRLTTFDPTCERLRMLQHALGRMGRECGVRCNIFPHPKVAGDTGDIRIDSVPPRCATNVISALQMTPLLIELRPDNGSSPHTT